MLICVVAKMSEVISIEEFWEKQRQSAETALNLAERRLASFQNVGQLCLFGDGVVVDFRQNTSNTVNESVGGDSVA